MGSADNGAVGRDAILPLTLAHRVMIWPGLFRIVRDTGRPISTRKQAMFWLGQTTDPREIAVFNDILGGR